MFKRADLIIDSGEDVGGLAPSIDHDPEKNLRPQQIQVAFKCLCKP